MVEAVKFLTHKSWDMAAQRKQLRWSKEPTLREPSSSSSGSSDDEL